MEMSVKTAKGKEFEIRFMGSTVIGVTSVLYIEFIGKSLVDIVSVFSDSAETERLDGLVKGQIEGKFKGYTNLIETIVLAESGNIRIALAAPMNSIDSGNMNQEIVYEANNNAE